MQSTRAIQLVLILLAVGLVAFLFFNGKNNSTALAGEGVHDNAALNMEGQQQFDYISLEQDVLSQKLKPEEAREIRELAAGAAPTDIPADKLARIAAIYEEARQPAMAGYYYKQLAVKEPAEYKWWYKAGKNYFNAQETVNDELTVMLFLNESMSAYEKVLSANPDNLEAKADQAVNYIEGKGDVMKGVGMLREIVQVQPDNRRALYYLGILSIRSNQLDKAIERFNKLISLGPEGDELYPFYFRMLGQCYAQTGEKGKALQAFSRYKEYTDNMSDGSLSKEADELIKSVQ